MTANEILLTNEEVEMAMIGAVLIDNAIVLRVQLDAEDFVVPLHQKIWSLVKDAVTRGKQVTAAMLGAGSPQMSKQLDAYVSSTIFSNAGDYAKTLRHLAERRRLRFLFEECAEKIGDGNVPLEQTRLIALRELHATTTEGLPKSAREIAQQIAESPPPVCYPTGLPTFDTAIAGGLFAGKLLGIAARKKVGKTMLLGTISYNLSQQRVPHLFIAMEMSAVELEQRSIARRFGFNSVNFLERDGYKLRRRAAEYASEVSDSLIYHHSPGASLGDVLRMVASAIALNKITGVILDYWQLVGGKEPGETEEYHLRTVAQSLADICRRENIWAIVAAQVNQEGNTRGGEGLKLACDAYFTLHREKADERAWLEMEESRYCRYASVGSETTPGLILNTHAGPYFEDAAMPRATHHWSDGQ